MLSGQHLVSANTCKILLGLVKSQYSFTTPRYFFEAFEVEPMSFVFENSNLIGQEGNRSLKLCLDRFAGCKFYLRYAIVFEKGVN